MTPEQIKATKPAEMSVNEWLKEIALQLATMNTPKQRGRPPKGKNG